MNPIANLTAGQLRKAANLKEKIASLQNQLNQIFGAVKDTGASVLTGRTKKITKRKPMSAAARAKIAAAARARWKKAKAAGKKRL